MVYTRFIPATGILRKTVRRITCEEQYKIVSTNTGRAKVQEYVMACEVLSETMGTVDVADNGEALCGKTQPREFIKGKRRAEQEAQVNAGKQKGQLPKKRFYRARAHSNPLSDCQFSVPIKPEEFDWSEHFPTFFSQQEPSRKKGLSIASTTEDVSAGTVVPPAQSDVKDLKVRFADIGCGFGGLIVKLSALFPDTLMVGMELRDKVSEYVKERIIALRQSHAGQYENITVLRTNAMKYLPNYFEKGQLQRMFFLFPDPHFKEKNHRRRIISTALLAEYAYIMAVGGVLYTITDVQELGEWMNTTLDAHPLFEPLSAEELEKDVCVDLLSTATEEGQKVERNQGTTYKAIYRRILGAGYAGA